MIFFLSSLKEKLNQLTSESTTNHILVEYYDVLSKHQEKFPIEKWVEELIFAYQNKISKQEWLSFLNSLDLQNNSKTKKTGRKLFISDIHGCFEAMISLFQQSAYNPSEDILIVGGDMINRGPQSGEVIKEIKSLQNDYPKNVKVLLGNHEEMMIEYLHMKSTIWIDFGGLQTINSFEKTFKGNQEMFNYYFHWIEKLPIVYQDEEYVYSHAGVDFTTSLSEQPRDIIWQSKKDLYKHDKEKVLNYTKGRPLVHGHTPSNIVSFDGARISCDLGAALTEQPSLSLVDLTNKVYYEYSFSDKKIKMKDIQNV